MSKKNIINFSSQLERDDVLLNLCWTSNARVTPSDVSSNVNNQTQFAVDQLNLRTLKFTSLLHWILSL